MAYDWDGRNGLFGEESVGNGAQWHPE